MRNVFLPSGTGAFVRGYRSSVLHGGQSGGRGGSSPAHTAGVTESRGRRKELQDSYKHLPPEAGVYRIVNRHNGRALLGSTMNLNSVRSKLAFARSTYTPSALDLRLGPDFKQYGADAFTIEVLETLAIKPEMTPAQVADDLSTLEALWRERPDGTALY